MSKFPLPALAAGFLVTTLVAPTWAREPSSSQTPEAAPEVPGPAFEDVLGLPSISGPQIAPAGPHEGTVVYSVRIADWEANRYDSELHLARPGEEPFQLTRTDEASSTSPRWSPDGRTIAFLADRGDKNQVYVIRSDGGEARPLTAIAEGVADFEFSPDGRHLALLLPEVEDGDRKARRERYGRFAVEDAEFNLRHLWLLDLEKAQEADGEVERPAEKEKEEAVGGEAEEAGEAEEPKETAELEEEDVSPVLRRLTGPPLANGDDTYTVTDFAFAPDGQSIAFAHQPDPRVLSFADSDLAFVDLVSGEIRPLVERPGFDGTPRFSPDGRTVLFTTANGDTAYYKNNELATVPTAGGEITVLTADFDEDPRLVEWTAEDILFLANQRTRRQLFLLDPADHEIRLLCCSEGKGPRNVSAVDATPSGERLALLADDGASPPEIYRAGADLADLEPVTTEHERIADWPRPTSEVIEWRSRDNTPIEGVLYKPANFEPGRRYPLLVVIHGGPAAISRPRRVHGYVYPVEQWLAKGALVLEPNYRGSTGYGEDFRAKNVGNLGIGDAWDVLSGVDHLIAAGLADPELLGAMGWSQGGYISAFLTTTSRRFRAISVGAGISNWMTYYVNTDIHPFTRHYLEATPWEDPDVYARTSPMHYIRRAQTPTLIQHGENDRRVPLPNAYELYQGLEDMEVEARLVVYQGFGHGISKPKERLAAVWHNWLWFARHLFEEDVELTAPLP